MKTVAVISKYIVAVVLTTVNSHFPSNAAVVAIVAVAFAVIAVAVAAVVITCHV